MTPILYRRFADEIPTPLERFLAGALLGLSLWIAASWVLAVAGALTRVSLIVLLVLWSAAACRRFQSGSKLPHSIWVIVVWVAFVLWRGAVVPPATHDALTYHLPKAAMIAQAHGFPRFDVSDPRIRTFPSNYELLLADVMILTGSDALTEWVSTFCFLLFLGVVAMYAQRWWGAGVHVPLTVLAAASAPLLLLHSGHDKNDLLTGVYMAGALYWAAAWCVRRGAVPAVLAIVCIATAVGTKMTAAAVVIGLAPFVIVALIRKPPRVRALAAAVGFALLAVLLCGGWVFVRNARSGAESNATIATAGMPTSPYGEWRNVWEMPYLILRVSFGGNATVPWNGEHRTWLTEDLYASHFGALFGVAVLALPFGIARYRDRDREKTIASLAAAIAFLVLLPIAQVSRATPPPILRFSFFLLPIVYGWTLAPAVRELASSRFRRWVPVVAVLVTGVFAAYAIDVACNDLFAPLDYARWCAAHRGTRRIHWSPNRAASIADAMAGPRDTIAVAPGPDVWRYPAYGAGLARRVVYVETPREIPPDAKWVVIDSIPGETHFLDAIRGDPRFALVYRNERMEQAVFRRR